MNNRCFICCNDPFPFGTANSNYIRNMAKALYKAHYEVIVVGLLEENKASPPEHGFYEGINYINIVNKKSRLPFRMRNHLLFGKDIINILNQYEVSSDDKVLVYTDFISATYKLLKKYKKNNLKGNIAYCIVEWFQAHQFTCSLLSLDYIFWKIHFDFLMPKYEKIISISENLSKHFMDLGCRTLVLPCLVDCDKVESHISRTKKEHFDFIYPGAATNKDSLEGMLKGLLLLSNIERKKIKFHFTTLQPEKLLEATKCTDKDLGELKDVLVFHGRLKYEDLIKLYYGMDFLFLAREKNIITESNFPSKVSEMLAYSTVPVCSRVGDYTKLYLEDNLSALLFEGASAEDCANAFRRAISLEENVIYEMRKNARNLAERMLDFRVWDIKLKEFLDV